MDSPQRRGIRPRSTVQDTGTVQHVHQTVGYKYTSTHCVCIRRLYFSTVVNSMAAVKGSVG